MSVKRQVVFFEKPGPENTISVVDAVKDRLGLGDLRKVIVPVTTGKTAKMFSERLGDLADIVTISESELISIYKKKDVKHVKGSFLDELLHERLRDLDRTISERLRREIFDIVLLPFFGEKWDAIKETLYIFGQGMKVAIEVSIASVELNKTEPYLKVIAVGGTESGADTAVVIRTAPQRQALGKNKERRLIVEEILCMPREK
ncbi:MAG: hypothetical protein QXJ17_01120 [Nitrososphaeria archaeon]